MRERSPSARIDRMASLAPRFGQSSWRAPTSMSAALVSVVTAVPYGAAASNAVERWSLPVVAATTSNPSPSVCPSTYASTDPDS